MRFPCETTLKPQARPMLSILNQQAFQKGHKTITKNTHGQSLQVVSQHSVSQSIYSKKNISQRSN